jgi:hypothetical protein
MSRFVSLSNNPGHSSKTPSSESAKCGRASHRSRSLLIMLSCRIDDLFASLLVLGCRNSMSAPITTNISDRGGPRLAKATKKVRTGLLLGAHDRSLLFLGLSKTCAGLLKNPSLVTSPRLRHFQAHTVFFPFYTKLSVCSLR